MPKFTAKRESRLIRGADGKFKEWTGGKTKAQLKKKENTFQGIAIHIGKEFKKQYGRVAKVGDCVRFKTKDGSYHKQAFWYIRTKFGWRKHGPNKPSKAYLKKVKKGTTRHRKGR